jgi:Tol biopolymer transport system component
LLKEDFMPFRNTESSSFSKIILVSIFALLNAAPSMATYAGTNGRIAFAADRTGSTQLYTANADGTDLFQLTNLPPAVNPLAWALDYSPDGRRIVFSHDMTGALELYVINVDGTGLVQITHDNEENAWPRWSPDGEHIVFGRLTDVSSDVPGFGVHVITTMRADGTEQQLLSSRVWDSYEPEYTTDGKHIVFGSNFGGFVSAVWIMDTHGKQPKRLTIAELQAGGIDVSPDGRQIVFHDNQNSANPSSIFTMNIDGTHIRRLTSRGHFDLQPVYSPDGTKILFLSDRASPDSVDAFVMDSNGSHFRRIVEGASWPDWGPQP